MNIILFYIFSILIVISSFLCVTSKKVLRAAVYLLFVLVATAGIYFLYNYLFLGAVQLSLYAGGIIVLIIFSVMLTGRLSDNLVNTNNIKIVLAGMTSLIGATFISVMFYFYAGFKIDNVTKHTSSMKEIATALVGYGSNGYALPFEVISILLLAVMFGAIIIAKSKPVTK